MGLKMHPQKDSVEPPLLETIAHKLGVSGLKPTTAEVKGKRVCRVFEQRLLVGAEAPAESPDVVVNVLGGRSSRNGDGAFANDPVERHLNMQRIIFSGERYSPPARGWMKKILAGSAGKTRRQASHGKTVRETGVASAQVARGPSNAKKGRSNAQKGAK